MLGLADEQVLSARWVFPVSGPPLPAGTVTVRGDRIVAVDVRSADGGWEELKAEVSYFVASDNYIRFGGDDFTVLRDNALDPDEDLSPIQDILIDYLSKNSPVSAMVEGRIKKLK